MELYSVAFLVLIAVFLLLHELCGRLKKEIQWIVKLAASVSFYLYIAGLRLVFLGVSVLTVWTATLIMDKMSEAGKQKRSAQNLTKEEKKQIKKDTQNRKRIVLFATIAVNLLILIGVKYILPSYSSSLVLPLGISFYTFMAISYLVDVYGGKYPAQRNLAKLALFLSWFPQMLQGPINRYDYVSKSLYESSLLSYEVFRRSVILFVFGAIKKYALANVLAPCVNEVFLRGDLSDLPGSVLLFTALLFAIEQYADFSGGIDMVMAVSALFGVRMNDNFKQPYFSRSVSGFWRRWHISLGSFLRDYVFYPFAMLKGMMKLNEKVSGRFGRHIGRSVVAGIGNLLVFLLVGLWHGSELHYILWGLYNGIIIAVSDFLSPVFDTVRNKLGISKTNKAFIVFQIVRTFILIVFAGYFDAISDVNNSLTCFKNTFTKFEASGLRLGLSYFYDCGLISDIGIIVVAASIIIVFVFSLFRENHNDFIDYISKKAAPVRWAVYFVMVYVMLFGFAASGVGGGFMYAAF